MDRRRATATVKPVFDANAFLWEENRRLREENALLRKRFAARDDSRQRLAELRERHEKLTVENAALRRRVAELTRELKRHVEAAAAAPKGAPPSKQQQQQLRFKANLPARRRRKRPGRKAGHAAALRPIPTKVDVHQQVPLPRDTAGKASCPHCKTRLSGVRRHRRLVEDVVVPAEVIVTCYHTASGFCPSCRKRVESRAPEQPPAADLPHAQLGLNSLATAAVMRVCYRLPLRQVTGLFQQVLRLRMSPATVARQLQRMSRWLAKQHERLKLSLRLAGVVHMDETSWRIDGRNAQLWTLTNDDCTLYHVDRSRSGKVARDLLGKSFGAGGDQTLTSDFYAAYDRFAGPQQKCLAHLQRELKETAVRRPELSGHALFKRCRRLIGDMLKLKAKRPALDAAVYERRVRRVERRLATLGETTWNDADADRIAARLKKYGDKLTTFLHKPEVDGTNNAAERALRPAVVMRKVTGGSRSQAGADAWATLASVMRTAQQHGRDVLETIKALLKAHWAGKDDVPLLNELLLPAVKADAGRPGR